MSQPGPASQPNSAFQPNSAPQPDPASQPDPADRSTWGPAPQPGSQPVPAPARSRSKWAALVGVLVFALAAAAAVGIVKTLLHKSIPAKQAVAGQCIQDPEKHNKPVVTDCGSDDAAYRVTAPTGSTCTQVPGTTTTYETMCLVGTKEDPATVLSSAKVGDCLDIDATSKKATISECTSGTHTILMILNNVSKAETGTSFTEDACRKSGVDAGSYESMYVWSFDYFQTSSVDYNRFSMKYDYAFCLGHPNS